MSTATVLAFSEPVAAARSSGRPVVALETSVLAQGLPHPRNLEALEALEAAVRARDAVPAWVHVDGGRVRVGADREELVTLATAEGVAKVARRDLPAAVASGGPGATTVSATLWAAHRAGIEVLATGGIGGVHLGTGDVSADLLEMARTPGLVVCSGPKSIVDPEATLERLEELGVAVVGYQCALLPFFLARHADLPLEHRADGPREAAAMLRAARDLGVESALLLCNPVPEESALPRREVDAAVRACLSRAASRGVGGKDVTPFLLSCVAEVTGGRSIETNLALLSSNAAVAAEVAVALASG